MLGATQPLAGQKMMRLSAEEIALANLFTLGPEEPETLLASVLTAAEKEVEKRQAKLQH